MTVEELEQLVARTDGHNLTRVILCISRKTCPRGHKVRVKGMGLGEIANVQTLKDGSIQVVAWFRLKDVKSYIYKIKSWEAKHLTGW